MTDTQLLEMAKAAMKQAYAPYSGFSVGAALLCEDGTVFTGCNIENASFGATNCAERTALFKAVSEGRRRFTALAVVGGKDGVCSEYVTPCGICRQAYVEFCGDAFQIILGTDDGQVQVTTLGHLQPEAFRFG